LGCGDECRRDDGHVVRDGEGGIGTDDGARFDTSYYRSTHIPLAMKVMNAASVMLIEGVPNGSSAAPFAMIAHFQFASSEALKAALANPAMAEVRADVAKFTDIKPTVMLGKSL
jgi:uncharacterized protein (TIGR02118 family)